MKIAANELSLRQIEIARSLGIHFDADLRKSKLESLVVLARIASLLEVSSISS